MPTRHALKVIEDRRIQIFVAKPGENPTGWAVPVQRMLTVLQPLQTRTLRGTVARVAHNGYWIQFPILPAITERRMPLPRRARRIGLFTDLVREIAPVPGKTRLFGL